MKGKIKLILFSSLLAFGTLTGCGNSSDNNGDGSSDDGGNNNPIDAISGLDYRADEAQNKLKQLGSTQGFEITLEAISQEDDGTTSKESAIIGFKVETAWLAGEGAYVMTRDGTETYAYTATSGQYDYVATIDGKYFDDYITTITSMFYIAYSYNSYLDKVGPTTFLGRPATEYKFAGSYATAFADLEIIIDDETGITLKYAGKAQDLDGNAAAGSLVVTAFKTGEDVVRPVLNKNGGSQGGEGGQGEGGEGGDPSVTLSTAGKYSLDATQVRDPGNYANGYFEIGEDGSGVFCDYVGHQYIGTFVNDGSDIVMTATSEAYIPADGTAPRTAACNKTFYFDFLGDASWGIWHEGYHLIYKYDQGQGGDTPTDNLEDALITSAQYASLVTGMAYIGAEGNAKFNRQTKNYQLVESVSTLENDNGNYQHGITYVDASGQDEMTSVMFYAKDEKHEGYYDLYERQADFSWKKSANGPYAYEDQIFAEFAGLQLLSYVPFNSLSEPHFETSPYYSCSKFDYENDGYEVHLTNIKIYFNKGKLVHFSYTSGGYINIDVEITDIGRVNLELPEGGGEQPEKPVQNNALLYGTDGAKFVFDRAEKGGYQGTDFDTLIAALQNCSFNFFPSGDGELVNTNQGINNIYLGTYKLMKASSSNTGTVTFTMAEQYVNGAKNNSFNGDTQVFTYYAQEDELHMIQTGTQNGNAVEIHMIFVRSNTVPTPYDPEGGQGGGEQPTDSNWPAKEITAALKTIGFESEVIPALSDPTKLTEKGSVSVVDKTVVVTLSFAKGGSDALLAFYGYMSTLENEAEYTLDYNLSNVENSLYVFNSKSGKMSLFISLNDDNGTITIVAKEKVKASYPTEAISGWLLKHGVTDDIIEFTVDDADYSFNAEYNSLVITLPAEADAKNIVAGFINELTTNHSYTPEDVAGSTIYVGPNRTIAFYFYVDGSRIGITFGDSSNIPQSSEGYPSEKVEEYLRDMSITDSVPAFEYEGSEYAFYGSKGEDGVWAENSIAIGIDLPAEAKADEVAEQFAGSLTGYTYYEDEDYYLSPNKQVCINIYVDDGFVGITIFPYEEETYEDIVYHMACDDSWAEDYGAVLFAWVWGGNYEDGQWVALVGGRGQYTLTVDETATSFIIVRCYVGTVTPDWDIEEGDVVGRIYNQTEDFWFVDYFYDDEEEWIDGYVFHFNFTSEYPDNGD